MCKTEPLRIAVEAQPNARLERVELWDTTLRVWVRARPAGGQANLAIEQAIANALGLRRRQVRIIAGATSKHKLVDVDIADFEALRALLSG